MLKTISYDDETHKKILSGVNQLADTVKVTLGPTGRNVTIQKDSGIPLVTNDGVTIAKEVQLPDPVENMGAQIIREAAITTNDQAGDGTTTATVLAQYILQAGIQNLAAGANPVLMKKGIQGAVQLAAAAIKKVAIPVNDIALITQVASISANNEHIGKLVASAIDQVGAEGVITIEEGQTLESALEITQGMQYEKGWLTPDFIKDGQYNEQELHNPYILVTDREIANAADLLPILEQIAGKGRPLLIIAEKLEGEALAMLLVNNMRGVISAMAVHPPAYGNGRRARMEDIAIFTGGKFITEELGYSLREMTEDMLGRAETVKITRTSTTITGGYGSHEAIHEHMESLRRLIERTDYDFDKERYKERLAKFQNGTAVIKIGAATEAELKEYKLRAEDSLNAAQSAISEGIVPGGGITYLHIRPVLRKYIATLEGDRKTGAEIILKALEAPAKQIAENAGLDGSAVIAALEDYPAGTGYDAETKCYVNMLDAGIVDPAKVVRLALLHAASVSAVLLTTEASVVVEKNSEKCSGVD